MPVWLVNLLLVLLEKFGERILQGASNKWDRMQKEAEDKDDIKKAVKIKNRKHRSDNILNILKR